MVERLLVGFDGSEQSRAALAYATEEWPAATCLLVYVIDPTAVAFDARTPTAGEEWYERRRADAAETLSEGIERIQAKTEGDDAGAAACETDGAAGVDTIVETRVAVGNPAAELVEAADDWNADHVVVGSHGRTGVRRILLGSVAEQVVRTAPTPVTVVR